MHMYQSHYIFAPFHQVSIMMNHTASFYDAAFATRECSADGTWRVYPDKTNNSWTDYTQCTSGQQGTEPSENYLTVSGTGAYT